MKSASVILLFAALASGVPQQRWFQSNDGSNYYIETEQKYNWYQSWNECARRNMSLLATDTFYKHQQVDTMLRKLFTTCPAFWSSGSCNALDKRYEWATTGEAFSFTNWGPSQPSGPSNTEPCILYWTDFQWHDYPCANKLGFVCEENQLVKQKSQELEALKREIDNQGNELSKYKNVYWNFNRR